VLILQSYHPYIWTDEILQGINSVLNDERDFNFFIEYMDTKRFHTDTYYQQLYEFYRNKYADNPFDVVIACDDDAYDFARTHQADLLKNAPIVFCGVSGFDPTEIEGRPITGILEKERHIETLQLAFHLLPETRSVYIIADKTKTTTINVESVQAFLRREYPRIKQYLLNDLTYAELLKTVESLPEDSLVLYMGWWADSTGQLMVDENIRTLLAASKRPVFSGPIKKTAPNWGVIGGYYTSGLEQGAAAAELTRQILNGADPATLPVVSDSEKVLRLVYDHIQMRRFGLDESLLPDSAIVINLPKTFYEISKQHLWLLLSGGISLLTALLTLILFMRFRIRVNLRLHEKDLRFRNLVESTSDWMWEVDAAGRCTYSSPQVREILGYEPAEIVGKTPFDFMPPEEARRVSVLFSEVARKKEPFKSLENMNLRKDDGREVFLESNGVPVFNKKGTWVGYCGINRDITERKKAEQLTARRQAEMDSIFAASPAGIALVRNRKLVHGNTRFSEITGYREDQLDGVDSRMLYLSPLDYEAVGRRYQQACEEGVAVVETRWVRADNAIIDVMLYLSPLDAADPDKGFVVIIHDISELKAARHEAMEEKARSRSYLDVVNVIIVVLDTAGHVKLINKKGCEILERRLEEVQGADWFSFLPGSYQEITRNVFGRMMADGGKIVEYFENPIRTPSGAEKLIAWHNAVLRDESGNITGVISSGEDITRTRAVEQAARDSDQRLRMALSAAQTGTWQWRAATGQETRDANLNALLGLPPVETTQAGEERYAYVHPDDRQAVREEFKRAVSGPEAYLARFRIVRVDGQTRWVLDQGKPFFDFNGQLDYVTGAVVDITAQVEYQQRYQNVIDSAPMGILTYQLDADDRLVLTGVNNAASSILRDDFSASVGKPLEEVFPELAKTPLPDEYRRICRQGGRYHGDHFEYQDTRVSGLYEFDAFQTSPGNVAVVFTDVTERMQTERQLRFTQFALDHAGEAAYWMGPDAKFVYVNEKASLSLGYMRQELLSMTVHDIDPDFPNVVWGDHWDKVRRELLTMFESHHKKKDGTVFPVEITANFVEYDGREYICSFVRDISERRAAEQEREVLMEQLRQRNDELQSIVFTAAHDLRSPLVNIAGFTGELEKGLGQLEELLAAAKPDKPVADRIECLLRTDVAESLSFVRFGCEQMDMLLNGLMRLSVVGAAPIKLSEVNMKELFGKIIEGLQYRISENVIDISVPDELPNCFGDFAMLTQVFSNLIDNAIKYRHPERTAIVEIGASIQDDTVKYTVTDNGIGIESPHLEKVFELFHRLHPKQDQDGQGLGLTIVRRILDRLGGTARIESVPGLGTTVHVRLPRA
jgi:PAS domain S-box-containing protein